MHTPTISVVLPVYNASRYVKETLDSLSRQTFTDFEVLVVDDESSDDTPQIIEAYAAKDNRFKLLRKPNGGTAAKSVSYALPFCAGKYFFFSSHDDFFSNDLFERMVERAKTTGAECIIPDLVFYEDGVPAEQHKKLGPPDGDYDSIISGEEAFSLSVDGWKISGNGLKELSSFRASGFESEFFNDDEFSVWRHFLNSEKVAFSHGTYFYRQTPTAITKRIHPLRFETLIVDDKVLSLIETAYYANGGGITRAGTVFAETHEIRHLRNTHGKKATSHRVVPGRKEKTDFRNNKKSRTCASRTNH